MKPLCRRRALFVQEYLVDLNPIAAAQRAGYKKPPGNHYPYAMLAMPEVAAAVRAAMDERARRTQVDADRVVRELVAIAFAEIGRVVSWRTVLRPRTRGQVVCGTPPRRRVEIELRDSDLLDAETRAAIASMRRTATGGGFVKMHDKVGALELLGRHLGLFGSARRGWCGPKAMRHSKARAAADAGPEMDEADRWRGRVLDRLSSSARAELRAALAAEMGEAGLTAPEAAP